MPPAFLPHPSHFPKTQAALLTSMAPTTSGVKDRVQKSVALHITRAFTTPTEDANESPEVAMAVLFPSRTWKPTAKCGEETGQQALRGRWVCNMRRWLSKSTCCVEAKIM